MNRTPADILVTPAELRERIAIERAHGADADDIQPLTVGEWERGPDTTLAPKPAQAACGTRQGTATGRSQRTDRRTSEPPA